MSDAWLVVLAIAIGTIAIKASGPVLLGGRPLPDRVQGVVALLAPALLAALVATNTFASGQELVAGARAVAIAVAALAIILRAPILVVVILAAASAGLARLVGIP